MNNTIKALKFASAKHKGQVRKYSGEAYIIHPIIVSQICQRFTNDENTIIAAILHDVVEDSDAITQDIHDLFGLDVANIVKYCSEISSKENGSREYRKKIDREHYARGVHASKVIKIADAIHNCSDMKDSHSTFTNLYYGEKILMVDEIIKSLDEEIVSPSSKTVLDCGELFSNMILNWSTIGIFAESIKP